MRRIGIALFALVAMLVGLASPAEAVKAGQLCKKEHRGTSTISDNGDRVTCLDKNGWRWVVTGSVSPPPSTTTPPPVTPPPTRQPSARQLDTIRRLYQAYFLRAPDPAGLSYWGVAYANRMTLPQISDFFAKSTEFQNRYGTLDNAGFIDLIYKNVLARTPDPSGRAYWIGVLNAGRSRGAVMIGFSESPEFVKKTGTLPPEGA